MCVVSEQFSRDFDRLVLALSLIPGAGQNYCVLCRQQEFNNEVMWWSLENVT